MKAVRESNQLLRINTGNKAVMNMEQVMVEGINKWQASRQRKNMLRSEQFYRNRGAAFIPAGMQEAREELSVSPGPAQKTALNGVFRKLVDQKTGCLFSKPPLIRSEDKDYQERLAGFFNIHMQRMLRYLGKEAVKKGIAWLHVHYDEAGQLCFRRIPSEQIIPFWQDETHAELQAVIRINEAEDYEISRGRPIQNAEWWDSTGVRRYCLEGGKLISASGESGRTAHFQIIERKEAGQEAGYVQGMNWERVPFIPFKYNEEEQSLLEMLEPLFSGAKTGQARDEEIFRLARGVDTAKLQWPGSVSDLGLKNLYADLELDCSLMEVEFQTGLLKLCWFINSHLFNTTGRDYSAAGVDFSFMRQIPV